MKKDLLIELGTEELPPKTLKKLAIAFAEGIAEGLEKQSLAFDSFQWYASPRHLAVMIHQVEEAQADKEELRRGPAVAAAYDADGKPTKAAEGFARSCGTEIDKLDTLKTDKGEWLSFNLSVKGKHLSELLADIIEQTLKNLPIAKRMRWGSSDVQFVRPVHWSVVLLGDETIPLEILGTQSSHITYGHRFHHPEAIHLTNASDYVSLLKETGKVIVDYQERQQLIANALNKAAESLGGMINDNPSLLDEVTSINEWPVAVTGSFDPRFLELPDEVLISSMEGHQKYFPVFDAEGKLLPNFITFANIDSNNADAIQQGNERVLLPRLSDAEFFWKKDQEHTLEAYSERLATVLFQKKLGTMADKVSRISALAVFIAETLSIDPALVTRAAKLAKCDLMTSMVGEFPELQGSIGRYYAENDGEHAEVALAIEEQYQPRFAGDDLPASMTGRILSLAEKLDTLCGIFSIGQIPTGDKDPFALRRAALSIVRLLTECEITLDVSELLQQALKPFSDAETGTQEKAHEFILDRLRSYYLDKEVSHAVLNAVLTVASSNLLDVKKRIAAVIAFARLEEAEALAAANKRISNILKKASAAKQQTFDEDLLEEEAEIILAGSLANIRGQVDQYMQSLAYDLALQSLSTLRTDIDNFFDGVMVNCENEAVKNNRIALLATVQSMFQQVADISEL